MRNQDKGALSSDSLFPHAELRQLITEYLEFMPNATDIEEDFFQMFQATIAAADDLAFDKCALLHYAFLYRHTAKFLIDLQGFFPKKTTPCNN